MEARGPLLYQGNPPADQALACHVCMHFPRQSLPFETVINASVKTSVFSPLEIPKLGFYSSPIVTVLLENKG